MRVATVDGLVTLFYDGSKELWNKELNNEWLVRQAVRLMNDDHLEGEEDIEATDVSDECKEYFRERHSWQQVIVVDGVTVIPHHTFAGCYNVKRVIIADTVIRIGRCAFISCKNLVFIKWSLRLEYIGKDTFQGCNLSSVFIPPGCRQIGHEAFRGNYNLTILNVPQDTELGDHVFDSTKLRKSFSNAESEDINTWLKNRNNHENFALHRDCASFEPSLQMIVDTMKDQGGPHAFKVKNTIGITPSEYLKENPYAHVKEKDIIKKYVLQMTGEDI